MVVKSRKVANAIVVTIPSSLNVPENVEFEPYLDAQGNIVLKRVDNLEHAEIDDIHAFMDQFTPLMKKLKDK
ncbi:hypothetical protein WOSG25_010920 [Weissella oryzae SG25]|uniref:Uncharacterized protein n=1 Tax=Weissella oryzae (strain DSM 25784 / JCM 18191 / LMG 30913 / SG25) TaxID=1329250 RepID=A0A069CQP2_WEIOS|nr:hypothetical protein [Weissella oryzae]GAK30005.1 hypothetical protein WOSG25_010920 [Weissella oryzae SG25]